MSNPVQSNPTPIGEFKAHFGGPPGSTDLAADCKKWENLCGELLAEREKLRAEMAKLSRESETYRKSLIHMLAKEFKPGFDVELAFAHLNDKSTIEEIIAELERSPGK